MRCNKEGCDNPVTEYRIKARTYSCHSCAALWSRYKLTRKQRDQMLCDQGGVCAICGTQLTYDKAEPNKKGDVLCVDHCHNTGVVRGLLCRKCNVGLGKFEDDPDRLVKASEYLLRNGVTNGK